MSRRETEIKEYEKDKDVIKKRDVLDSLTTAINQSKKELEDLDIQKEAKIKELGGIIKDFDKNNTVIKEHVESLKVKEEAQKTKIKVINEEISEVEAKREEVKEDIRTLSTLFATKKAKIDSEVAVYEKEATKKSKALAKSILEQEEVLKNLTESTANLEKENKDLVANIASNKAVVSKAQNTLDEVNRKEKELTELSESKTKYLISLSEDINEKEKVSSDLDKSILSRKGVLTGLNRDIGAKEAELVSLNKEKGDFEREKLIFSETRVMILAKEQFIKEKYEIAGLKYE